MFHAIQTATAPRPKYVKDPSRDELEIHPKIASRNAEENTVELKNSELREQLRTKLARNPEEWVDEVCQPEP